MYPLELFSDLVCRARWKNSTTVSSVSSLVIRYCQEDKFFKKIFDFGCSNKLLNTQQQLLFHIAQSDLVK